ncbi:unnamed protein product [Cuscuta europaea]|uniref:BHLH domain-containing protein n=1 Tax=Cuscuta europaea TaxID=41803 RepID=A0A9P1EEW4_CUSEU|nr:unnamed protein product [Cuscuta europaea]
MDQTGFQDSFVREFIRPAGVSSGGDANSSGHGKEPGGPNAIKSELSPAPSEVSPALGKRRAASPPVTEVKEGRREVAADHDGHIWTERERRKRMRNMFTHLHALLPQLPLKVDKATIVDEAAKQIMALQTAIHNLEKLKQERQLLLSSAARPNDGDLSCIFSSEIPQAAAGRDHSDHGRGFVPAPGSNKHHYHGDQNVITVQPYLATANNVDDVGGGGGVNYEGWWSSANVSLSVCGEDAHVSVCCEGKIGLLSAICYVMEKYKIEVLSAHVSSPHRLRTMLMIHARVTSGYAIQFPVEEIYRQAAEEILLLCG